MLNSQLRRLVEPPAGPVAATGDWTKVIERLACLPSDYMAMVSSYGAGCFDDFVWLFSPFSDNQNLNLFEQVNRTRGITESLAHEFADESVPRHFPEPGGLLPFAVTDNGDYLCWTTEGEPDNWTVVVWPARSPDLERTRLTASQFFVSVLGRTVTMRSFPTDFPSENPLFRPVL
jgi:hypothetical protein